MDQSLVVGMKPLLSECLHFALVNFSPAFIAASALFFVCSKKKTAKKGKNKKGKKGGTKSKKSKKSQKSKSSKSAKGKQSKSAKSKSKSLVAAPQSKRGSNASKKGQSGVEKSGKSLKDKLPADAPKKDLNKSAKSELSRKDENLSAKGGVLSQKVENKSVKDDISKSAKADTNNNDQSVKPSPVDASSKLPQDASKRSVKGDEKPSASKTGIANVEASTFPKGDVCVEPNILRFSDKGGQTKFTIDNKTGKRVAVKVRCSDNDLYRINPVFSTVDKDQKGTVDVTRASGNVKVDKLAVVFTQIPDEENDAMKAFKNMPPSEKPNAVAVPMFVS